jgi:hypothetical protein
MKVCPVLDCKDPNCGLAGCLYLIDTTEINAKSSPMTAREDAMPIADELREQLWRKTVIVLRQHFNLNVAEATSNLVDAIIPIIIAREASARRRALREAAEVARKTEDIELPPSWPSEAVDYFGDGCNMAAERILSLSPAIPAAGGQVPCTAYACHGGMQGGMGADWPCHECKGTGFVPASAPNPGPGDASRHFVNLARNKLRSDGESRCRSDSDGDCDWPGCPQLRDGEPTRSGRHCPLDGPGAGDGAQEVGT